jgi:WD repeat-containing protein 76
MEDISEYEQMRLARIARNKEKLSQLNIPTIAMELQDQVNRNTKKAAPIKGAKRAKLTPSERPPPRRSSRVQGLQSDGAHIISENRDNVIISGGEGSSPPSIIEREKYPKHPISFCTGNLNTDAAFLDILRASSPLKSTNTPVVKLTPYAHLKKLSVAEENVAKLTLKGTSHLDFHPTEGALIIAAGDKGGNIGIWMVDHHNLQIVKEEKEGSEEIKTITGTTPADNLSLDTTTTNTNNNVSASSSSFEGIVNFMPHYSYISGLKWSSPTGSVSSSKLFTSAYDGSLRVLDPERGEFVLAYGDEGKEYSCMEISPNGHIAYLGDKNGELDIIDLRTKVQLAHNVELHGKKINTLQISPGGGEEDKVLLSASTDTTVAIWDMRKLHGKKDTVAGKQAEVCSGNEHQQSCQAAYWAPDGSKKVVSTSFDDTVVIWDARGTQMEVVKKVKHNNNTGRYMLPFRAVWWNNSDAVVVGGLRRTVDVISSDGKGGGVDFALESEYMTAIPSRHCVHPTLSVLASATGSGRVHIFK